MDNKLIIKKENFFEKVKSFWKSLFKRKNNEINEEVENQVEEKRNTDFIKSYLEKVVGDREKFIEAVKNCSIEELEELKEKYNKSINQKEQELEQYKKQIMVLKERLN